MPKRVQSPSSINLYKQCPRRYFYQYILKYPTKENIHTIRGNVVHNALEQFFTVSIEDICDSDYKRELSFFLKTSFDKSWTNANNRLKRLGLSDENLNNYYTESVHMLANWITHFFNELDEEKKKSSSSVVDAFKKLMPIEREKEYLDKEVMVRGFIDVVQQDGEDIIVMDYKTSKSSELKEEYLLQLGIYAFLYEKKHGKYPKKVGLWFLKDKPITIDVTPQLIKDALFNIEQVHFSTESDSITEYPKKESGLCKWSSGQCDFYDICKRQK